MALYFHNHLQLMAQEIAEVDISIRTEFSAALGSAIIVVVTVPFFVVGFAKVKGAFASSIREAYTRKLWLSDEEINKINKDDLAAFEGVCFMLMSMASLGAAIAAFNEIYWLAVIFGAAYSLLLFGSGPYIKKCIKNGSRFRNFKTIDPNKYKE